MSDDIEIDLDDLEKRMSGALTSMRNEFQSLRTGRASATMIEPVTVNVPEPRMLTINVWDKANVAKVEKAIRVSGLGINPVVDGTILRLPIPELNEERRRELAKLAGKYAEDARIAVRNVRRDGMDQIKKAKADGMGEDDQKLWSDEIQSLTDAGIKNIDDAMAAKQEEIMQV